MLRSNRALLEEQILFGWKSTIGIDRVTLPSTSDRTCQESALHFPFDGAFSRSHVIEDDLMSGGISSSSLQHDGEHTSYNYDFHSVKTHFSSWPHVPSNLHGWETTHVNFLSGSFHWSTANVTCTKPVCAIKTSLKFTPVSIKVLKYLIIVVLTYIVDCDSAEHVFIVIIILLA